MGQHYKRKKYKDLRRLTWLQYFLHSGLFSEKVSKVFLIASAIDEKKDSVGMLISSELCLMLLLCCNFTGLDVNSFSFCGVWLPLGVWCPYMYYWSIGDVARKGIQRRT